MKKKMMELKHHHFVVVAAVAVLITVCKTLNSHQCFHHLCNTLSIFSPSPFAYKLYGMTKLISNKMWIAAQWKHASPFWRHCELMDLGPEHPQLGTGEERQPDIMWYLESCQRDRSCLIELLDPADSEQQIQRVTEHIKLSHEWAASKIQTNMQTRRDVKDRVLKWARLNRSFWGCLFGDKTIKKHKEVLTAKARECLLLGEGSCDWDRGHRGAAGVATTSSWLREHLGCLPYNN